MYKYLYFSCRNYSVTHARKVPYAPDLPQTISFTSQYMAYILYVHIVQYIYEYKYVFIYVYTYIYEYIYIYIRIYTYMYIYVYISLNM